MLVVGAYRDVDPTLARRRCATTLAELAREPVTRTLALAGLGEADVARFVALAAPAARPPSWARRCTPRPRATRCSSARSCGCSARRGSSRSAPLAIPHSVRETIGRRLRHLSDECNALLTLASVLGREFDLRALARVSGLERGAVLELLDEATRRAWSPTSRARSAACASRTR